MGKNISKREYLPQQQAKLLPNQANEASQFPLFAQQRVSGEARTGE